MLYIPWLHGAKTSFTTHSCMAPARQAISKKAKQEKRLAKLLKDVIGLADTAGYTNRAPERPKRCSKPPKQYTGENFVSGRWDRYDAKYIASGVGATANKGDDPESVLENIVCLLIGARA